MQVINIFHARDDKKSMNLLCRGYGVDVKAGYDISIGKSWSHITGLKKGKAPTIEVRALWWFLPTKKGVKRRVTTKKPLHNLYYHIFNKKSIV